MHTAEFPDSHPDLVIRQQQLDTEALSSASNETPDAADLLGRVTSDEALCSDVRALPAVLSSWNIVGKKLRVVKPSLKAWPFSNSSIRTDEAAVTRLRIGHTRFTHGHVLRGVTLPVCNQCGVLLPWYTFCREAHVMTKIASHFIFM
jgi:hypothetical protein